MNAFTKSADYHRTRARQMLAQADTGADATKFSLDDAMRLAQIHVLLGILDTLISQSAFTCACPRGMDYHADNCRAYPAPDGEGGLLVSAKRPVGGTTGWAYPAGDEA